MFYKLPCSREELARKENFKLKKISKNFLKISLELKNIQKSLNRLWLPCLWVYTSSAFSDRQPIWGEVEKYTGGQIQWSDPRNNARRVLGGTTGLWRHMGCCSWWDSLNLKVYEKKSFSLKNIAGGKIEVLITLQFYFRHYQINHTVISCYFAKWKSK